MAEHTTPDEALVANWLENLGTVALARFNNDNLTHADWAPLADALVGCSDATFAMLRGASHDAYMTVLGGLDGDVVVVSRPAKRAARYAIKHAGAVARPDGAFKCVSDLAGFSVELTDAPRLRPLAASLVERFRAAGGAAFTSTAYGPSISERVYALLPGCAIAEISVRHPFAAHVFKHDSALRDEKDRAAGKAIAHELPDGQSPIDYWRDGAWNEVQDALLAGDKTAATNALASRGLAWDGVF